MIDFIKHRIKNNFDFILNNSYKNCHIKGLSSIAISQQENGGYIRFFVTDKDHELYKNHVSIYLEHQNPDGTCPIMPSGNLSLGFHPHRFDLTLKVIKGEIENILIEINSTNAKIKLSKYLYESKLLGKDNNFTFIKEVTARINRYKKYTEKSGNIYMESEEIHTIYCPKDTINAWWIFEGNADPEYEPYLYTNDAPVLPDNSYEKMTREEIFNYLKIVFGYSEGFWYK